MAGSPMPAAPPSGTARRLSPRASRLPKHFDGDVKAIGAPAFEGPVAVTTAAGAAVTSLGAPFYNPPQPTTFFDPIRGSGVLVFDGSYRYSSSTRTPIPYSATAGLIGRSLNLLDGIHYGFAEFNGTYMMSYGFESTSGRGIDVGQTIAAVPEPETYALLLAGLGAPGAASRRRRVGGSKLNEAPAN